MLSAFCYKLLKPHLATIIEHTIFPLMCFSDADDNLWKTDPKDFIKQKYGKHVQVSNLCGISLTQCFFPDTFDDFVSPVEAACMLLEKGTKKRKDFLDKAMFFASRMLTDPSVDVRKKDGALHMVQ